MKKSKITAHLLLTCALVFAINIFLSKEMFDSYFPHLDMDKITLSSDGTSLPSFKIAERHHQNADVISILVEKNDTESIISALNTTYLSRYSGLDTDKLIREMRANNKQGFSTFLTDHGKQSLCIIMYTKNARHIEENQWATLGDRSPETIPLFRMSIRHEFEHCIMPRWILQAARKHLTQGLLLPTGHENTLESSLSEAFADIMALAYLPGQDDMLLDQNSLLHFRSVLAKSSQSLSVYTFNDRIDRAFIKHPLSQANSNAGRLKLVRESIETMPLPKAHEIDAIKKGS